MGIRLTGISTPFGGAEWEYTNKQKDYAAPIVISPDQRIKVFISSICGDGGKYDRVRAKIKQAIEDTQLADVYLFEAKDASTLPAGDHYVWALEDSDVCIFLIDNSDGITPGVQKEIDTVRRKEIKALYYFCDESTKEKTALEQSIMGATYAKSKTVHKFDDLSQDGAQALINDIVTIYLNYCRGRLIAKTQDEEESFGLTNLPQNANFYAPKIPKTVLSNIDKCKYYILKLTVGFSTVRMMDEEIKTSKLDEWGEQFLAVLFEAKSIKNFNTGMFLDALKELQDEVYFGVVTLRWQAIQSYYLEDITKCIDNLEAALKLAKETSQPTWVIQDILIDLRNVHLVSCTASNCYTESSAQKELDGIEENVNYPVLDRINESLQEKYISGLYKKQTESPYTITLGNNYDQYGELLASSFIVSIYNGSLTHILLYYDKIRDFVFYLCCKYDDWRFRKDLLKLAIFSGKEKEIKGIQESYPEVLNEMNEKDAAEIMEFCNNHPIAYRRISSQLLAFGTIGYYLNDSDYANYEGQIISTIKGWLSSKHSVIAIGQSIFTCLTGTAYRMHQDILAEICCSFMDNHYSRWYMDMFKFIANRIDINKMSANCAQSLIEHIITVLENEQERKQIGYAPSFLYILRKQNLDATKKLDAKIAEYLPEFYTGAYKLETTLEKQKDFPDFIQEYIKRIEHSNETQGKNGQFFGHGTRDIATVRAVLLEDGFNCSSDIMDSLISAISETLLVSKEGIDIKLDAVYLLTCIAIKYPEDFSRNNHIFKKIIERKNEIIDIDNTLMSSNIDKVSLEIAIAFLQISMGENSYVDILEGISYIQNDMATSISVTRTIIKFFEVDDSVVLPQNVEAVILQNVLQWLRFDNMDIKWNATRILFMLIRNPENVSFINQKVINLIDTQCVYIKNLILRQLSRHDGIYEKTYEYVFSKCKIDPCFVVRKVCAEVQSKIHAEAKSAD